MCEDLFIFAEADVIKATAQPLRPPCVRPLQLPHVGTASFPAARVPAAGGQHGAWGRPSGAEGLLAAAPPHTPAPWPEACRLTGTASPGQWEYLRPRSSLNKKDVFTKGGVAPPLSGEGEGDKGALPSGPHRVRFPGSGCGACSTLGFVCRPCWPGAHVRSLDPSSPGPSLLPIHEAPGTGPASVWETWFPESPRLWAAPLLTGSQGWRVLGKSPQACGLAPPAPPRLAGCAAGCGSAAPGQQ